MDIPADGRLTTDETRQWRVLDHLYSDTTYDPYVLDTFYKSEGWSERQADQDVKLFAELGYVDEPIYTLNGYPTAVLSSQGRNEVQRFRRLRQDPIVRAWACRSSLYCKAPADLLWFMSDVTSEHFAFWLGQRFSYREVEDAVEYLQHEHLVTGLRIGEGFGLAHPKLTAKGLKCVEHHGGDVRAYDEAQQAKSGAGHNFYFNDQAQVAAGDRNEFIMHAAPHGEDILQLVEGLLAISKTCGLAPNGELDELYDAAVQDLTSSQPSPEPARRFADRLKGLAAASGNAVALTTVNALTTELVTKLIH